jgi:hypothetical protein
MLVQNSMLPVGPAPSTISLIREQTAVLMSLEFVIADRSGIASAAARCALMRLFRALGGAVAVFSEQDSQTLDRVLGLPDVPLIDSTASPQHLSAQMQALLQSPPFAGRHVVLCGAAAAPSTLRELVLREGGIFAVKTAMRAALGDWLEQLAPMPVHLRAHA